MRGAGSHLLRRDEHLVEEAQPLEDEHGPFGLGDLVERLLVQRQAVAQLHHGGGHGVGPGRQKDELSSV